jgi:hypothetical protein
MVGRKRVVDPKAAEERQLWKTQQSNGPITPMLDPSEKNMTKTQMEIVEK